MYFKIKLLIINEPLTALSVREKKEILRQVEKARESGVSVIFITHNVYPVYPVAERFVMLDRGIKIGEVQKKDASPEDIIEIIASGKMSQTLKTYTQYLFQIINQHSFSTNKTNKISFLKNQKLPVVIP